MKRVTVFCGSSSGYGEVYFAAALKLGELLAKQNIELVYGGARVGLMGAVAEGVLKCGGNVVGVIPHFLKSKEIAHDGITELIVVNSMHERKTKMNDLSDGVIALPGGFGTMDELFEMLTWAQLGLHSKPIGILNIGGYYNDLINMVNKMVENGFLKKQNQTMILVSEDMDELLMKMKMYIAPSVGKWISNEDI